MGVFRKKFKSHTYRKAYRAKFREVPDMIKRMMEINAEVLVKITIDRVSPHSSNYVITEECKVKIKKRL